MDITISKATPADAQGIQEMLYETWVNTYPNPEHGITLEDIEYRHRNMRSPEAIEKQRKFLEEDKDTELSLVAKDGEKVVGVCYLVKEDTKNQLQAIYVLPNYQRRGIGQKFWNETKKFFDNGKDIYVEVVSYNEKAVKFYESLGFKDTGRRFEDERFRMRSGSILPEMELVLKA